MNDPKFERYGGAVAGEHPPHGPAWKRMHLSPFFWVAFVGLLMAMTVFVMTNNLSFWPGDKAELKPVPVRAP